MSMPRNFDIELKVEVGHMRDLFSRELDDEIMDDQRWSFTITRYATRYYDDRSQYLRTEEDVDRFQESMVKSASVAKAAWEWAERRREEMRNGREAA